MFYIILASYIAIAWEKLYLQGRSHQNLSGQVESQTETYDVATLQNTISMLMLRGFGGMPPWKILKIDALRLYFRTLLVQL